MQPVAATLSGVVAIALFSSLALLTTMTGGIPPFQIVGMGFTVSSLLAAGFAIATGEDLGRLLRQPAGAWALGIGGFFGYHFLYFAAMRTAPPAEANLLNYLWPLLIVLFSAALPGYRLGWQHVAGGLCGLAGTYLLVMGDRGPAFGGHLAGELAAIGAAVTWALYSVLSRRFSAVPSSFVGVYCAATAALAWVCHGLLETTVVPQGSQWPAIVAIGLGPLGAAFYAWDRGIKRGNLQALGTLSYGAPLLSTLLLILAGKGQASGSVLAACALIVGGAIVGNLGQADNGASGRTRP